MPKKTKKKKMHARAHRDTVSTTTSESTANHPAPSSQPATSVFQFQYAASHKPQNQTKSIHIDTHHLRSIQMDIGTTILLATMAFVVEGILYIVLR